MARGLIGGGVRDVCIVLRTELRALGNQNRASETSGQRLTGGFGAPMIFGHSINGAG